MLAGSLQKKLSSEMSYKDIVKAFSNDALMTSKQTAKDLLRTMPRNACFSHMDSNKNTSTAQDFARAGMALSRHWVCSRSSV